MRRVQGMTLTGMLLIAVGVIILAVLFMKVTPIYIKHYQVKQAVNSLTKISSDRFSHDMAYNMRQIRTTLMNQFYIDSVVIKQKEIVIKPLSYKKFQIIIDYNVKKNIVANISVLVHFRVDQEVEINAP